MGTIVLNLGGQGTVNTGQKQRNLSSESIIQKPCKSACGGAATAKLGPQTQACRGAWCPGWTQALPEGPGPSSCEGPSSASLVCA